MKKYYSLIFICLLAFSLVLAGCEIYDEIEKAFESAKEKTYTITFNANGGGGSMDSVAVEKDSSYTIPACGFSEPGGRIFVGWNTAADGSGTAYAPSDVATITADTTLYAQWSPENSYTIEFAANGGSGSMAPCGPQKYTKRLHLPPCNFTPITDYIFTGWNTKADGTGTAYKAGQEVFGLSTTDDSTVTLYAQWSKTLNLYSWAELKAISNEIAAAASDEAALEIAKSYGLADTDGKLVGSKEITVETYGNCHVRILGFRHDEKSVTAGGGLAGISFEFVEILGTHKMNVTAANLGGWNGSNLRLWLDEGELWVRLPAELQASTMIVSVKKMTNNTGNTASPSSVTSTDNKLWLLSVKECYGDVSKNPSAVFNAEGTQYKRYKDLGVNTSNASALAKKNLSGTDAVWWLRSPDASNSSQFTCVNSTDGSLNSADADNLYGVSLGFSI